MGLGKDRNYIVRRVCVAKGTNTPPPTNILVPSSAGQEDFWAVNIDHHQEQDQASKTWT